MKRVLVAGAGGFIGGHLVTALLDHGCEVVAVDIKSEPDWWQLHPQCDPWPQVDLRDGSIAAFRGVDTIVNLAADMGGMGFIATHRADCTENARINLNLLRFAADNYVDRYLFASSACVYNQQHQTSPDNYGLREQDAYPAMPDSDYGWEKLYSERCVLAFADDYGFQPRIARIHNCYGPHGTWHGGREKAPAALCRKVAEAVRDRHGAIEIWGDGMQTRSFMWIGDCVDGLIRLLESNVTEPVNLGSDELVTVNQLARVVEQAAGVNLDHLHVPGPQGVRGRCADNSLIRRRLNWAPTTSLADGISQTYPWIADQVNARDAGCGCGDPGDCRHCR